MNLLAITQNYFQAEKFERKFTSHRSVSTFWTSTCYS